MSDPTPAPGWYPAPHANNEQRYWDGARWTENNTTAPYNAAPYGLATAPAPKKKGLAIAALIVGIVAFLTGIIPVIGAILGIVAVILGIIALVRHQPKGLGITAIVLGGIAAIVSVIMTISLTAFNASAPVSDLEPKPVATESAVAEEPSREPVEETTPEPPPAPVTPDLSTFTEIDDRSWALIAKDPDSHAGTNVILYGSIMQFDSATGRCSMLIDTAATQKESSWDYEQSVMAYAGDASTVCPVFDPLVEDDHVKVWATVRQSFSYDTQIGGNTTVPMVEVWQVELLPATEY